MQSFFRHEYGSVSTDSSGSFSETYYDVYIAFDGIIYGDDGKNCEASVDFDPPR